MNKVMKKFKLIKEYPQSPNLNTIVTWREESMGYVYIHPTKQVLWGINGINPEDYPEFWEEISKPLLVTEDGIDIHHGDPYWLMLSGRTHCLIASQYEKFDTSGIIKRYSSKEAVCYHIKAFSISDLEKLHHHGWKHLNQMKVDLLNSFK